MNKKIIILGVTLGGSSRLLDDQPKYFKNLGYEVFLMSQDHVKEIMFCKKEGIRHLPLSITNDISLLKDIITLFQIIVYLRKIKPDIINFGTPKISLLGMIAGFFCRVPKRIYSCWGLRFETESGLKKNILLFTEKLTVFFATMVVYISRSSYQICKNNNLVNESKVVFIGRGSSNGVNTDIFSIDRVNFKDRSFLVSKYNLSEKLVIGFVGRVTRDKGVYELVDAFEKLHDKYPHLILIMMGHIKCDEAFEQRFLAHPGIIHIPFQDNVPLYMSLFHIFILPSWREGFPNVPIQAAAMGLPVVVSDATGCIDSVNKDVNGLVFKVRDKESLYNALLYYIENDDKRVEYGQEGLKWAKEFSQESIWEGLNQLYIA